MIKFSIGGRTVDPKNMKDAMMAAILENVRAQLREKIGAIRDPETGTFPTVVIRGDTIDNLTLHVEGPDELVALVKQRLGMEEDEEEKQAMAPVENPKVFLSYTSNDADLAKRIAEALQANGVDVWWDRWCIYPGDSLRQMIDEGISECTHFLALLTPESISKPWVNQEMDAGLVRKLNAACRFLPVRFQLPASSLPPLLSGMHSPEIAADEDIAQLINDIYGLTRKPPLGAPPAAVSAAASTKTGYSAAANAVARYLAENTKWAVFGDPQIRVPDLADKCGLSIEDTRDALYELSAFLDVTHERVLPKGPLYAEFDGYFMDWDPAKDALILSAAIINDPDFPSSCKEIADRYGWDARRLNPVIYYLLERDLIVDYRASGCQPWAMTRIVGKADKMRRFVKSRS